LAEIIIIMDYASVMTSGVLKFIQMTERFYSPDAATFSLNETRQAYDQLCRAFEAPMPPHMVVQDKAVLGRDDHHEIGVRCYSPEKTDADHMLIYLHGGGFTLGGLDTHHSICADISYRSRADLIAVDYRLAPEHRFPTLLEDAEDAVRWAASTYPGRPLILIGDSAGGWLAAMVSAALSSEVPIAGQVLIYPWLGGAAADGSYLEHANAPLLSRQDVIACGKALYGDDYDHTLAVPPLASADLSGLPPTRAFAAECDPLKDDVAAYCDRISAVSGDASYVIEKGLPHGYMRGRHHSLDIAEAFEHTIDAIIGLMRSS
jgi:acetyl esterase